MRRQISNSTRNLKAKLARLKARLYDRRLGIEVSGRTCNQCPDYSLDAEEHCYQPTFYGRLEKMIRYLKPTAEDVFVDLGCGKGRVVFFVALQRLKKVIGVELNKELYTIARKNLANLRINKTPVRLVNIDAVNFDVRESTIFFMFNPFGYKTLEGILRNIKESLVINPRKIRIVYYAPRFDYLLDGQDWLIREGKIENDACLVWRNR